MNIASSMTIQGELEKNALQDYTPPQEKGGALIPPAKLNPGRIHGSGNLTLLSVWLQWMKTLSLIINRT